MHVFVTGATGWVGSVVVRELLDNGHSVTGLARSAAKGEALAATGARVLRGTLDDLDLLRRAADASDGVIHCAFNHDFSKFAENSEQDRRAIEAIGAALKGSQRPLLVTSGVALVATPGGVVDEDAPLPSHSAHPRKSETAARALRNAGISASAIRLAPTVHGIGDHGFVPILVGMAREKGVSAYVGEGSNRWPAVHRLDAARLYRLALERGAVEPAYHAIAEEGLPFRTIAEAIGRGLDLPVESRDEDHFGWFAGFAGADMAASSRKTREWLGWSPGGPTLLDDLAGPDYFRAS